MVIKAHRTSDNSISGLVGYLENLNWKSAIYFSKLLRDRISNFELIDEWFLNDFLLGGLLTLH
jgi:hypothetical protein